MASHSQNKLIYILIIVLYILVIYLIFLNLSKDNLNSNKSLANNPALDINLKETCSENSSYKACAIFSTQAKINGALDTFRGTYLGPELKGNSLEKLYAICNYEGNILASGLKWMPVMGYSKKPFINRWVKPVNDSLLIHVPTYTVVNEASTMGGTPNDPSKGGHIGYSMGELNVEGRWTGINNDHTEAQNCKDWTSSKSTDKGAMGLASGHMQWTVLNEWGGLECDKYRSFVCVQVP